MRDTSSSSTAGAAATATVRRLTQVYRADGADVLAAVNRALDDAGFRGAPPSLALAGQVPHDAQWPDRIAALLR